jgi:hypothetical protein
MRKPKVVKRIIVGAMGPKGAAAVAGALAHHLQDAIARVREDVEKVEFWADAMTGFAEPVPDYCAGDATVWVPGEQAKKISPAAEKELPEEQSQQAQSQRAQSQKES